MAQDDEGYETWGIPWETVRAEFRFDDVGRRALPGVSRDELIAKYPDLIPCTRSEFDEALPRQRRRQ
jgi:hypothetical protein